MLDSNLKKAIQEEVKFRKAVRNGEKYNINPKDRFLVASNKINIDFDNGKIYQNNQLIAMLEFTWSKKVDLTYKITKVKINYLDKKG